MHTVSLYHYHHQYHLNLCKYVGNHVAYHYGGSIGALAMRVDREDHYTKHDKANCDHDEGTLLNQRRVVL